MIDRAEIVVQGGKGGDGLVSFRREKFRPRGGPNGGSGGDGGDVYLEVDPNLDTLADFRRERFFKAPSGERGKAHNKKGKSGEDLILNVPPGTEVWELISGKKNRLLADLTSTRDQVLVAQGGRGGRGNKALQTSSNRLPCQSEEGRAGERRELILELKLIADIGIIGLPNAGKSTLLKSLTAAKPKIAPYVFTTLDPNLGVAKYSSEKYVLADVPGLIKGASSGKGLGQRFLRHIERTKVILHLIDPLSAARNLKENLSAKVAFKAYKIVRGELASYESALLERPEIVAINKIDREEVAQFRDDLLKIFQDNGVDIHFISAKEEKNLDELQESLLRELAAAPSFEEKEEAPPVFRIDDLKNRQIVFRKKPRMIDWPGKLHR